MVLAIWLMSGAWLLGLYQVSAQPSTLDFRHLDYRDGLPDMGSVQDMLQDRLGRVWIAYDRGLFRYDGFEIQPFPHVPEDSTTVAEVFARSLYEAPDGRIWVGLANRGISIFDPATEQFSHVPPAVENGPLPVTEIWSFYQDPSGILWLAGHPGIVRFDPTDGRFSHYLVQGLGYSDLQLGYLNDTRKLIDDPTDPGRMLVATRGGLLSLDKGTGTFRPIPMPFKAEHDLDLLVNDFFLAGDSVLWMATWSGYIVSYQLHSGRWRQYPDRQDVSGLGVFRSVLPRGPGSLWVTGTPGFGYLDVVSGQYQYYRHQPGDPHSFGDLLVPGRMLITRDSTILVAGRRGISISDPYAGYDARLELSMPYLSAIRINGKEVGADTSPAFLGRIPLEGTRTSVQFEVTWPVFQDAGEARFRFRLDGHDSDWVLMDRSRIIQYTNLEAGRYTLRYEVSRPGEVWIGGRTSPSVQVSIPFWERPLLWFLGVAVAAGLVFGLFRVRASELHRKQRIEDALRRQVAEVEMTALRAQMNPHFLFNSLNSIKNFILKEDLPAANEYLTKFSRLMRTILRNSKSRFITLEDELTALELYIDFEVMRFRDRIQVDIAIDPSLDPGETYLPPLMIQPYVENAIWHGLMQKEGPGRLDIRITNEAGQLRIRIRDDGIGRDAAMRLRSKSAGGEKSYGMQITRERVELVRQALGVDARVQVEDLQDAGGRPAGTEVTILLPLLRERPDDRVANLSPLNQSP